MVLDDKIKEVREKFEKDAQSLPIEQLKNRYVGREGAVRDLFALLKTVPPAEKGAAGQALNTLKADLEKRVEELAKSKVAAGPKSTIDLTLPGRAPDLGRRHPIYKTWDEISRVFTKLGFDIVYGPEIETEENNFEALNIPMDHPARDGFDTFYIEAPYLVRSHTSPVQIRTMKSRKPPIRVIAPGKVFRPDKPDAGHSPMFHQIEGLIVGPGITFAHLKGVLDLFAKSMWGEKTNIRFRPSFFPFTGAERRGRRLVLHLRRQGLPRLQGLGLGRDPRQRHGPSEGAEKCGIDAEANTGSRSAWASSGSRC
jgi:phenylalanyl-tRNA synthetase alpha chain